MLSSPRTLTRLDDEIATLLRIIREACYTPTIGGGPRRVAGSFTAGFRRTVSEGDSPGNLSQAHSRCWLYGSRS
ncbi:hypothetical protein BDZ89DRAFT_1080014 [Hymenopellis radicata]|nr:hypothetical protein BDZ89DRAFT_1080014 [Hymenopellis radicata]